MLAETRHSGPCFACLSGFCFMSTNDHTLTLDFLNMCDYKLDVVANNFNPSAQKAETAESLGI